MRDFQSLGLSEKLLLAIEKKKDIRHQLQFRHNQFPRFSKEEMFSELHKLEQVLKTAAFALPVLHVLDRTKNSG